MSAPVGNEFWKARSSHGRAPIFASADALWFASCEYFDWVEANPLYETKAFGSKDGPQTIRLPKMRAMTNSGLCIFLDISRQAWTEYRARQDFGDVCSRVDEVIRTQKFEGASADLFNANIIARDLGLADRSEQTGANGGPIKSENIQRIELVAAPFPPDHPALKGDQ
ncbi:terminase small subunit [Bradyrhizobium sp. OK095]|uniref:terminase small subunit n=1 Tax=Bradyrhizobium sp. OK095 TaxID=1882760 RepID=UPI0008D4F2B1|nr:terminase small subunit [Bradyrhizobium sp. OK095]SEN67267.1 DNA-packaging protein gp3 [Bradyrhizobium sp. OK095]